MHLLIDSDGVQPIAFCYYADYNVWSLHCDWTRLLPSTPATVAVCHPEDPDWSGTWSSPLIQREQFGDLKLKILGQLICELVLRHQLNNQ